MNRTRKIVFIDLLKRFERKKKGMEVESNGHDISLHNSIWMWYDKYFLRTDLYLNKIKKTRVNYDKKIIREEIVLD